MWNLALLMAARTRPELLCAAMIPCFDLDSIGRAWPAARLQHQVICRQTQRSMHIQHSKNEHMPCKMAAPMDHEGIATCAK